MTTKIPQMPSGKINHGFPSPSNHHTSTRRAFTIIYAEKWAFVYIVCYDRGLALFSSLLLLFIVFIPFPTALLGAYGDHLVAVIFYAVVLALSGILLAVLWFYIFAQPSLVGKGGASAVHTGEYGEILEYANCIHRFDRRGLCEHYLCRGDVGLWPCYSPGARRAYSRRVNTLVLRKGILRAIGVIIR